MIDVSPAELKIAIESQHGSFATLAQSDCSWQIGVFLPTHEVPPKSTDNDYPLCLAALSI